MTPLGQRRGGPPRVVLDSNVVLSALVFPGGAAARLRHAWTAGECVPIISSATTQELMRVLGYPKFRLSAAEQEELLADYLPFCQAVRIPLLAPAVPACRDPFDLPFLQLAVAGKAQALVTGDRDLLVLATRVSFSILTLQGCLAALTGPG